MSADSKPIKVRVSMTIEVDPEIWELEYGDDPADKAALRETVRAYAQQQVAGSAAADSGAIRSVQ